MSLQYELVLEQAFFPELGGRPYYTENVVQVFEDKAVAEEAANSYNRKAPNNQYYSVRKVKEV